MKKDLLLVLTIESVVIGVVLGFVIRPFNPRSEPNKNNNLILNFFCFSNDTISLIGFPGEIFMQIVEMMILPMIVSSVISGKLLYIFIMCRLLFKDKTFKPFHKFVPKIQAVLVHTL